MNVPFFSIGVTTYDREELLRDTLNSILAQTFSDYEVIVSNDNPGRKISAQSMGIDDPRFRFINQENNIREVANLNYLLQNSSGRYFTWTADDDLYLPEFLKSVYKALIKYSFPKCAFASFNVLGKDVPKDTKDALSGYDRLLNGPDFLYQYSRGKLRAISVMGVFEKETLKGMGGMEDICAAGWGVFGEYMLLVKSCMLDKIAYIDRPLISYRVHGQSWGNTNIELKTYLIGAENLLNRCIPIFKSPRFKNHFYAYLYHMLNSVILTNLGVMSRRQSMGDKSVKRIGAYLLYAGKYIESLKGSRSYPIGALALIHAEISAGLFLVGSMIMKRLGMRRD